MAGLATVALVGALCVAPDLVVDVPLRAAPAAPAWTAVTADPADGQVLLQAKAGYEAERFSFAVAVGYRAALEPGWREGVSLAAAMSRRLDRRTHLDLQLWGGRADGGLGAGLTWRRALGPSR